MADPYGIWPPNTRANNIEYHQLQNDFARAAGHYLATHRDLLTEGARRLGKTREQTSFEEALSKLKKDNGEGYVKAELTALCRNVRDCIRICDEVIVKREENLIVFKDNDPGHINAVEWWEKKRKEAKDELDALAPVAFMFGVAD